MSKPADYRENVPIDSIRPWDRNPRKNIDAIPKVARSIAQFGFVAPIVVRRSDMRIIAGHTRWMAAKRLGLKDVPVRFVDLDDTRAAAYAVADNRLNEVAEWDHDALREILGEINADGFDVEIVGFSMAEVDAHVKITDEFTLPEDAGDPPVVAKSFSVVVEVPNEAAASVLIVKLQADGLAARMVTR